MTDSNAKSLLPQRSLSRRVIENFSFLWRPFRCPFCKENLKHFCEGGNKAPVFEEHDVVGGGWRMNVFCPYCRSTDRERLIYLYLTHELKLARQPRGFRVLHIAPESNLHAMLSQFAQRGAIDYLCGDKFVSGYTFPPGTRDMDITDLEFDDGTFDLILCNHVLEHVPDDALAMAELHRVLKVGGRAILQVPLALGSERTLEDPSTTSAEARELAYGQFDHVRLYGMDYPNRLTSAGFNVRTYNPHQQGGVARLSKFAVNPKEAVYVGFKDTTRPPTKSIPSKASSSPVASLR